MNRWHLFIALIFAFVVVAPHKTLSQDYPNINYTVKDGLPSNKIYEIYRDGKGFLWFATDKGVARYNGLSFEVFTSFNGLPDNEVFFFQEDRLGRLWLGTYNGDLCYYHNDTFHNAANTPLLNISFKSAFIKNVFILDDSSVAINFFQGKSFLVVSRNKLRIYTLDIDPAIAEYINIRRVGDTALQVRLRKKTILIDTAGHTLSVSDNKYQRMRYFVQNTAYFYDDTTVYDENNNVVARDKLHRLKWPTFYRVYKDKENVFFALRGGLVINETTEAFKGIAISCVNQDNKGNYWLSTLGDGVFVLKNNFLATRLYRNAYKGAVKATRSHQRGLFYATNYAAHQLDDKGVSTLYTFGSSFTREPLTTVEAQFYIDSSLRLLSASNRELVVMDKLTAAKKQTRHYYFTDLGLKSLISASNKVYLRSINYVQIFDLARKSTSSDDDLVKVRKDKPIGRIYCMAMAPDNKIWYSTVSGMYIAEGDTSLLASIGNNYNLKYFKFWRNALIGYNHTNKLLFCRDFRNMSKVDTLPAQNCLWDNFYPLDSMHMLVSTNRLYRLLTLQPPGSVPSVTISTIEDPFVPLQADAITVHNNNCYFFKDGAITSFGVDNFYVRNSPPAVTFKTLKTKQHIYPIAKNMKLSYGESKSVSISFSTLSFNGADVYYQYSISKNKEDNWRDFTGEINLAQPEYGTYTVKVRARSSSSGFSEPDVFRLVILRPFWATWWFLLSCGCFVAAVITLGLRYRINRLLRKKEKEHLIKVRFMKSEYRALNALMNPHFIFNTLNNVQDLINSNDKLAANEYLRIFADLVRQNMQNISKDLIPLQKEIDLIKNYLLLEKLRFEDKLNYRIDVDDELELSEVMIPPLLIQPLVENSIKHGILNLEKPEGFIDIRVYEQNNILYIEVKDNGVGMNYIKPYVGSSHESLGLNNIRQRIEQLSIIQNKQISFSTSEVKSESGALEWTVVTISIALTVDTQSIQ